MVTVSNLGLQYGKRILFDDVSLKFTRGNCYGIIGANGAGKSTFLKFISGEKNPTSGGVSIEPGNRMAVLSQNHYGFEDHQVLDTVIMGHEELYKIKEEKNAIYINPSATEEEGLKAAELENLYGEMGGWEAESNAATLLSNLGINEALHYKMMKELSGSEKVKVLLAQALFGNPDLLLLDEPTNDLDAPTVEWLADFLADYKNTILVVSHDRYFLDMICTHVVDIDFQKIRIFTGNYTFWYETSQLAAQQIADKNKKVEQKRKEMMEFIQRFSANASKSRQATSRKKALEKLNLEEIKPSSRKYPFIHFKMNREPGDQILKITNLSKSASDGSFHFNKIDFAFNKNDKIAIVAKNSTAVASFFEILAGNEQADSGKVEWGQTINMAYLPADIDHFFKKENDIELMDWLRQFSEEKDEQFIRSFLGRMLFSGEEVFKKSGVLSGGEKMRCVMSKMMLSHPNFLIMNEPTNHLDLESITALNNALIDFKGSLLLNTHDHRLMKTTVNRIIELTDNGIIDTYSSPEST